MIYPLGSDIKGPFIDQLKKYINNTAALASADIVFDLSANNLDARFGVSEKKQFIESCITQLKTYYLEPFHNLQDGVAEYEKFSSTLFDKSGIQEVLKRFIPIESKLEDFLGCTAGAACTRDTLELNIFDNLDPESRKMSAYEAILGCISAQTYFPSQLINGKSIIDAGTAVKNPSQIALALASKHFPADRLIEIFEVGTGMTPLSTIERPHTLKNILDPSYSLSMVMESGKNSSSTIMELLAKNNPLLKYHRIDFDLGEEIYLDRTTQAYFDKMSEVVATSIQQDPVWKLFINSFASAVVPRTVRGISIRSVTEDLGSYARKKIEAQFDAYVEDNGAFREKILSAYKKYTINLYPKTPENDYSEGEIDICGHPLVVANKVGHPFTSEVPILSIDGGGTRGVWPLKVLEYIEKVTKQPIANLFPVRGGTSIGGLISILLSIPGSNGQPFYTAQDVANLLEDADQIFPLGNYKILRNILDNTKGVMFDNSGLRKVLKALIERAGHRDLKLGSLLGNIGVLSFDHKNLKPVFLSNRTHPGLDVIDVAISTASAPVYLPDNSLTIENYSIKMGDGGVPDNNPVWYIYNMFNMTKTQGQNACILSLGTGFYPDYHPKRDELPFWISPAALLGYAIDSRTLSQNTLMAMYAKSSASNISTFLRVQWTLPCKINLTSSLPITMPLDSIPECLPIAYSDDKKIVDFKDLATIMAAVRMNKEDFISFINKFTIVENYNTEYNLKVLMTEQERKFQKNWGVRLIDSLSIKDVVLDSISPRIKQDLFRLVYNTCLGLRFVCDHDFRDQDIDPDLFFMIFDYIALTSNINDELTMVGENAPEQIEAYINKIRTILNFVDEQKKEGLLKFIFVEMKKIHTSGYYSVQPNIFVARFIKNVVSFIYKNNELNECLDYIEKQALHSPTFLNKLARAVQVGPRSLVEPLLYFTGAMGTKCIQLGVCSTNFLYAIRYPESSALVPASNHSVVKTKVFIKDRDSLAMFCLKKQNIDNQLFQVPVSDEKRSGFLKSIVPYSTGLVFSTTKAVITILVEIPVTTLRTTKEAIKSIPKATRVMTSSTLGGACSLANAVINYNEDKRTITYQLMIHRRQEEERRKVVNDINQKAVKVCNALKG